MNHTKHITAKSEGIVTAYYEGKPVRFDRGGWFNATGPAKRFGKRPNDWLALPGTTSYIAALARALGFDTGKSGIKLVQTSKVRGSAGTWLHPKLAVAFSRWLSDDFAVWCDMQIDRIIRDGLHQPNTSPSTVRDREPILIDSVLIMTRHGIPLPVVYRGLSHYAGVDRFRSMTRSDVAKAHQFAGRMLTGQDTGADWQQLQTNRTVLTGQQTQLELGLLNLTPSARRLAHAN